MPGRKVPRGRGLRGGTVSFFFLLLFFLLGFVGVKEGDGEGEVWAGFVCLLAWVGARGIGEMGVRSEWGKWCLQRDDDDDDGQRNGC